MVPAYFQAIDPAVAALASRDAESLQEEAAALRLAGSPVAAAFLLGEPAGAEADTDRTYPLWSEIGGATGSADSVAVSPLLTKTRRAEAVALLRQSAGGNVETLLRLLPDEPQIGSDPEWIARHLPARIGGILLAGLAAERAVQPSFLSRVPIAGEGPGLRPDKVFSQVAFWGTTLPFDALNHLLSAFKEPATLERLTDSRFVRASEDRGLLARLIIAGASPEALLTFLEDHPASGLKDLRAAFSEGPGGALLLVSENKPLRKDVLLPASIAPTDWEAPVSFVLNRPAGALFARIALFTGSAFFLLLALHQILPNLGDRYLARPTMVQSFTRRLILGFIVAGGFLFLLEPSLLRQPETAPPAPQEPSRLSLASLTKPPSSNMNSIEIDQVTLLILTIFFVLQVGLYIFCLVKLSEIRRQRVSDATKLHLLENEENLFDGGLYLGLGGTVASLIFLALGVVEASLMAAYASTLFGILSVSLFKIFHLRPLRRKLILSSRAEV